MNNGYFELSEDDLISINGGSDSIGGYLGKLAGTVAAYQAYALNKYGTTPHSVPCGGRPIFH